MGATINATTMAGDQTGLKLTIDTLVNWDRNMPSIFNISSKEASTLVFSLGSGAHEALWPKQYEYDGQNEHNHLG